MKTVSAKKALTSKLETLLFARQCHAAVKHAITRCVLLLALLCRFGFDPWGYDKNGFDRAGFDFQGLNKEGQGRFAIYTPTKKTKCGTNASEVRAQRRKDCHL